MRCTSDAPAAPIGISAAHPQVVPILKGAEIPQQGRVVECSTLQHCTAASRGHEVLLTQLLLGFCVPQHRAGQALHTAWHAALCAALRAAGLGPICATLPCPGSCFLIQSRSSQWQQDQRQGQGRCLLLCVTHGLKSPIFMSPETIFVIFTVSMTAVTWSFLSINGQKIPSTVLSAPIPAMRPHTQPVPMAAHG